MTTQAVDTDNMLAFAISKLGRTDQDSIVEKNNTLKRIILDTDSLALADAGEKLQSDKND